MLAVSRGVKVGRDRIETERTGDLRAMGVVSRKIAGDEAGDLGR